MTWQRDAPAGRTVADAWRPRYHVTAARNWLNDPNGPIQHRGVYHLFYQANPLGPRWGRMAWGHVSSTDLVAWTRHPLALVPDDGGPDADGCWSGCARVIDGRPVLYYTGIVGDDAGRVESVCRAWGSDDLVHWTKDPANPLIPGPPPEHDGAYHRDPFLWRDQDGWHLLLGDGTTQGDRHGRILRYDSADATTWTYGGVFFDGVRRRWGLDLGAHWECPALLLEGDTAVLVVSCRTPGLDQPLLHSAWFAGTIQAGTFHDERGGLVDHGDALYAATPCVDASGRHLLWGWVQDLVSADWQAQLAAVGALSLPRVVIIEGGRPRFLPVPGLERLRVEPLPSLPVDRRGPGVAFAAVAQMELTVTLAGRAGRAGWTLTQGADADGEGGAAILVDLERNRIEVTVAGSAGGPRSVGAAIAARDRHELRVFVDGSLIEVFLDGCAVTTRAYPSGGSWRTAAFGVAGAVRPIKVQAWALATYAVT